MKVKILKTTVADSVFVRAGSVVDVSEKDAKGLILLGKAVAVEAEEAPAPLAAEAVAPLNTETAEAVVETKLKKSRKK